jgi:hypothetical protein
MSTQHHHEKGGEPIMKNAVLLLTALAALSVSFWPALASQDGYEDEEREYRSAKFYGVVDALPQNGASGTWLVNGREVLVTHATEIKQKRGNVAVGVYVEVEGHHSGSSFAADEIEVKGRRR